MVKYPVVTKLVELLRNKVCPSRDSLAWDKTSKTVIGYLVIVSVSEKINNMSCAEIDITISSTIPLCKVSVDSNDYVIQFCNTARFLVIYRVHFRRCYEMVYH